nr:DUF5686 family protein [uncultured Carboxylicivirga sp.]
MISRCRVLLVLSLLLLSGLNMYGQEFIDGFVFDSKSDGSIPMVNVYYKGTTVGTITDSTGYFKLQMRSYADTVVFSSIGYLKKEIRANKIKPPFEVYLNTDDINLSEISVKPDDSWVRYLLKSMVEAKPENNPDKHPRYSYEKYTKWEYHIAHVDSALMNSGPFKNYKSYFKTASDSSKYLPVYLSEQIVHNQFQNKPLRQKSVIVADNTQGLGVLGDYEIGGYSAGLNNQYNFYDNFIKVWEENFVSPAASNGWFYYKYYLIDSTQFEGYKHYEILFTPRRKHDKVFRGHMVLDDRDFSIVSIDAALSSKTNMNFLKDMKIDVSYKNVGGNLPFYKDQKVHVAFDYLPFEIPGNKQRMELEYNEYSSFTDVKINPQEEVKLSARNITYESIKLPGSYSRDTSYWNTARHLPLTNTDKVIYSSIDSINQIPAVKIVDNAARMMMTGYYDVGKWEVGPYMNLLQFNKVEGVRLFAGGRTSKEISTKWMIWGGVGYGTRTQKLSGSLGGGYKFENPKRRVLKMYYDDRYIRMGENRKILYLYENMLSPSENNLISAFFVRDPFDELLRQKEVDLGYEHEWRTGFSSQLNIGYKSQYSPEFYPFAYKGSPVNSLDVYEGTLDLRFSFKEKVIDDEFMRLYLTTDYPIIHLALTGGRVQYADQTNNYAKIHATIKHNVYIGQTFFKYAVEGGMIFGKVPYTLLELPRGNETFGYYLYDFNMINYLEFAHDKYLHTYLEYHLNGFFFNRVPLFRSLGLREVVSAKSMIGSLSQKQYDGITIPTQLTSLDQPYLEVGAGLENILRIARIEAIWRVSPNSQLNVPQFGLRARVSLNL